MTNGKHALRMAFKRIEREVPERVGRAIRWLRHPASRWIRIPAGLLLILGGIFSILPFLGIWMLPLGLMLIAADVAFLQKPMARFAMASTAVWTRFQTWRRR